MFNLSVDDRLSEWINHRRRLDEVDNPLQEVWDFWHQSPFVPHNRRVDPFYQRSWPSPWEIIQDNQYDDFTRALMIGWTLKLTKKYQNSKIELKTLVDTARSREYNLIYIDETWVINFNDEGPIRVDEITIPLRLENLVEVGLPR